MQTPVSPVLPDEDDEEASPPLVEDPFQPDDVVEPPQPEVDEPFQPDDVVEPPQPEVDEPLQPEVDEPLQPEVVLPDVPPLEEVQPLEEDEDAGTTGTPFVSMSPPGTRARHTRPALHWCWASQSWPSSTSPL
jgi:hypothetical protein